MTRIDSIARDSGLIAPVLVIGTIVAATVVSSEFTWTASALSELGVEDGLPAMLFNGGLVVGGVLALPYAVALRRQGTRSVAALFVLALIAMALVGVFQMGHPLHLPVAVGFYLFATATMIADGLARRQRRTGRATLVLAVLHLAAWSSWVAGVRPGPGLALPELAGAVAFAVWMIGLSPSSPL
jgi:hypothetical membrane protein